MVQHKAKLIKHFRSEGRLFHNAYTHFARRMVARHYDRTRPPSGQKKARKLIWGEILNEFKDHPGIQDGHVIKKATDRYLKSYMASSPLYREIDPTYRESSTEARGIPHANDSAPICTPGSTSVSAYPVHASASTATTTTPLAAVPLTPPVSTPTTIGSWGPQQSLASADSELFGTVDRTDGLAAFLKSCEIAMDHHLGVFKNVGVTNLKSLKVLAGWPAQDQAEIWELFDKEGVRPFELKIIKRGLDKLQIGKESM